MSYLSTARLWGNYVMWTSCPPFISPDCGKRGREMNKALVIGRNGRRAESAVDALWEAGYCSIIQACDTQDGLLVLEHFHPELIIVLPQFAAPGWMPQLQELSERANAPMILAISDIGHALSCIAPVVWLEGSGAAADIARVHRVAAASARQLQAA